jgi:hypothetical protein
VAQTVCDLIAVPIDILIKKFREFHHESLENAWKKSRRLVSDLDQCLASGMYV